MSASERRTALVQAALEVIAESGIPGATTRAVTEHAAMPLASFHYVFASQEEMFAACVERIMAWETEMFGNVQFPGADVMVRTHQMLAHLAATVRDHPGVQLAVHHLVGHARHRPGLSPLVAEYRAHTRGLVEAMVVSVLGGPDAVSPERLERLVSISVAVATGMTVGYLCGGDTVEFDRVVDTAALGIGLTAQAMLAGEQ